MDNEQRLTFTASRLPMLDALRGVAALGILLYHLRHLLAHSWLADRLYLFVDVFFLLSGFVMAHYAEPRLAQGWSVEGFMRARLRRLWPMMAMGIIGGALAFATVYGAGQIVQIAYLGLLALIFMPTFVSAGLIFPLNGPQWSLFWELLANLAHALVLRRLPDRALLAVAGVFGLGVILGAWLTGCGCSGPNLSNWLWAVPRVGWPYVLGIWMGRQWQTREHQRAYRRVLVGWAWGLVVMLACLTLLPLLPLTVGQGDALVGVTTRK